MTGMAGAEELAGGGGRHHHLNPRASWCSYHQVTFKTPIDHRLAGGRSGPDRHEDPHREETRGVGPVTGTAAELPACRRPRAARHRPKPWGTPTAPAEPFGSEASSSDGTGNRVSVNGARTLVRATGAGSSFGNGGRFADKTGPKGHRCRATGGGAIGCGAGQPEPWPTWASPAEP
jgi:hypothetical protein